ncbi:pyridoxamine 5'-phosphate oxidase family protein [Streptomyces sp. BRB081]|uniref:pyridoxamine 5'-phosphate oxidase family protein n=1 Tax=Streptomyces sp. BRB081 TaxID=2769544 RepID=UPI0018ACE5D8|nr:pyridoxamine 5'-phosphate oxidase family protein [Streptomyces sp. BRB081]MBL3808357.1 pyridoxamine 5'-phosphate oxidase family protein [Streptomyces sp. BRB081]
MTEQPYDVELDPRYSSPDAEPARWCDVRKLLADAELYWLGSVRPGPRPHLTPVAGVWHDGMMWFCSQPHERKVRNLASNPACAVLTGTNEIFQGTDVVLEGHAVRVAETRRLEEAAEVFRHKYGPPWDYVVDGGMLSGSIGRSWVFSVRPRTVFAFAKNPVSQTRWRFAS